MFEQLGKPLAIPHWVTVLGAVLGAFSLGIFAGKLLAGGRPFDWVLDITNTLCILGVTVWFSVRAAMRKGN